MNKTLKTIDNSAKTITVSKDFLMKAGQFGTPEFYEVLRMKQDFPGYALVERKIKRNPEKRAYGNLTYDKMASFIEGSFADEEVRKAKLEEFEHIKKWAKAQSAAYAKVKNWFLGNYGEIFRQELEREQAERVAK